MSNTDIFQMRESRNFVVRDHKAYTEDNVLVSNLFVYKLSSKTSSNDLYNYFIAFGKITKVYVINKKRKVPKIGFVNFVDPLVAARVLEKSKHTIHFKRFYVKACDSWRQPIEAQMAKDVGPKKNLLDIYYEESTDDIVTTTTPVDENQNIMRLNDDCLLNIVRLLTLREQVRFARTCRRFRDIFQLSSKSEHRKFKLENLDGMTLWEIRDVFEINGLSIDTISGTIPFKDRDRILEFISIFCKKLKHFHIQGSRVRTSGLYRIFEKVKSIEELQLSDCGINDMMIVSLTKLPKLTTLVLSENYELTGKNLNLLTNLISLNLFGCSNIQATNFIDMCKELVKLKELDVRRCERLNSNAFSELVNNLKNLETLKITCDSVRYECIADLPKLKRLELLGAVSSTSISPQLFRALARNKCDQLEALVIVGRNFINHDNINDISRLTKLRQLSCANNDSLDDYCLAKLSNLDELEDLILRGCSNVKDDSLVHLIKKCKKLKRLNVQRCEGLTDKFIYSVVDILKKRDVAPKQPLTIFAFKTNISYFTANNNEFLQNAHLIKLEFQPSSVNRSRYDCRFFNVMWAYDDLRAFGHHDDWEESYDGEYDDDDSMYGLVGEYGNVDDDGVDIDDDDEDDEVQRLNNQLHHHELQEPPDLIDFLDYYEMADDDDFYDPYGPFGPLGPYDPYNDDIMW